MMHLQMVEVWDKELGLSSTIRTCDIRLRRWKNGFKVLRSVFK